MYKPAVNKYDIIDVQIRHSLEVLMHGKGGLKNRLLHFNLFEQIKKLAGYFPVASLHTSLFLFPPSLPFTAASLPFILFKTAIVHFPLMILRLFFLLIYYCKICILFTKLLRTSRQVYTPYSVLYKHRSPAFCRSVDVE